MQWRIGHDDVPSCPYLSAREWEIIRLVAAGLSNTEIAARLSISPATVHNHLDHIYKKLGVHGRVQLAVWVAKHQSDPASPKNGPTGP